MATQTDLPVSAQNRVKLDAQGRMIPRTIDERAADAERVRAALERMAAIIDNDPPGSTEEFMEAIDSGRPHRPLFKEYYKP